MGDQHTLINEGVEEGINNVGVGEKKHQHLEIIIYTFGFLWFLVIR